MFAGLNVGHKKSEEREAMNVAVDERCFSILCNRLSLLIQLFRGDENSVEATEIISHRVSFGLGSYEDKG